MKLYILLLLLLAGCTTTVEYVQEASDVNIEPIKANTNQNISLNSKYEGIIGVFNFTEFKYENCNSLIKHYNLVLAEEEPRIEKRKNNVGEARNNLRQAIDNYTIVKDALNSAERAESQERIQEINVTVMEKEKSLSETKEYFVKVKHSLRLIEEECKRLSSN